MPDQSVDLHTYLAELEAQRASIEVLIAGVRARLGVSSNGGTAPAPGSSVGREPIQVGRVRSDEFFRMSMPEAIRKYLEIMKQPQTPKEIMAGIKAGGILSEAKHFYANVFTSLRRLRKQNLVINTKSGGWGLAEWYAGKSGVTPEPKPKRKKGGKGGKSPKPDKKPKKAPETVSTLKRKASGYQAFVGEQMRAGKSMAEAAELWRKQHDQ